MNDIQDIQIRYWDNNLLKDYNYWDKLFSNVFLTKNFFDDIDILEIWYTFNINIHELFNNDITLFHAWLNLISDEEFDNLTEYFDTFDISKIKEFMLENKLREDIIDNQDIYSLNNIEELVFEDITKIDGILLDMLSRTESDHIVSVSFPYVFITSDNKEKLKKIRFILESNKFTEVHSIINNSNKREIFIFMKE